ncbi:MAG TPA: polysaccharide deacetylase family protein [bacterium]|nr:polysaccharide deacetylase family protein [bacterium]HQO35572.1 polysaccharide deacetylase family protein [bacterium]
MKAESRFVENDRAMSPSPIPSDDLPSIVLTVDVEDYFMSPEGIAVEQWGEYPSRIREGMTATLELFAECHARATFFFLGWVADRFPDLVAETARQGHEIGTHLYDHRFVHDQTASEFESTLERSLSALQAVGITDVKSHRAPGFSLSRSHLWQFEILSRLGIRNDSSINPHATYLYGERGAPRFPYRIGEVLEWPPATIEVAGRTLPVGGGGTLRILPAWYCRWARRRYLSEGWPPVIYLHPWELDPTPPRIQLPFRQALIHHLGLPGMKNKIRDFLREYKTLTVSEAAKIWGNCI